MHRRRAHQLEGLVERDHFGERRLLLLRRRRLGRHRRGRGRPGNKKRRRRLLLAGDYYRACHLPVSGTRGAQRRDAPSSGSLRSWLQEGMNSGAGRKERPKSGN
jgi:hypothetical protein